MKLGRIVGIVWSSKKIKTLDGCRLLILQPVNSNGEEAGNTIVVADPNGIASSGDLIVYVTGTDASQSFPNGFAPINASIVELVDRVV